MRIIATNRFSVVCLWALLLLHVSQCAQSQGVGQAIRLPNNSSITLLGWSYGKYHELVPGRESRHVNIPPPDKPDPNEIASCETEEDALVLWIRRAGPAAHVDNLSIHLAWMRQQVWVADENGHEVAPTIAHWRMNRSPNPKALADDPIALASFPRRGRTVIVRVYSPDAKKILGEFRIPNPIHTLPSPLTLSRFPATGKSGELEMTLGPVGKGRPRHFLQNGGKTEIYGDSFPPPAGYRPAPEEARRLESHVTFTFRGKPTTHWMLTGLNTAMWDSSGNQMHPDLLGAGYDTLCYLAPNIGEPVRLRISAMQKTDAEFVPDRVWTVSGVAVPAAGAVTRSESSIHLEDVDLKLLGIAGAGVGEIRHALFSVAPPGFVAVVLRLSYAAQAPEFVLRVSDAQGRAILPSDPPGFPAAGWRGSPWFSHGGSMGSTYGDYVYWVKAPPSGKIDLTFGLNRSHPFEFVVPTSVR
ncbi:MAG: hypothetical protein JWN14_263 [Chthonomonadales bacterium]|nr:hypothetical protein [Chthonomonadales bacterium]